MFKISPFTGGPVVLKHRLETVKFRGVEVQFTRYYYKCVDTGREFTDAKLDDRMMADVKKEYNRIITGMNPGREGKI